MPSEFEQAGYEVSVASRAITSVNSCPAGTTSMEVDLQLADVNVQVYDAVILTGGGGCQSQWDDEEAHRILRDAVEHEVVLAAVGCAPTILAHAGLLEDRLAAMCRLDWEHKQGLDYCEVIEDLGAICTNQVLVRDGLIVTARPRSWLFVPGMLEMLAAR
jgi:protease I